MIFKLTAETKKGIVRGTVCNKETEEEAIEQFRKTLKEIGREPIKITAERHTK